MKKVNIANRLFFSLKYLLSYFKKQIIPDVFCYHGNFKNLKLVMNFIKVISLIELNFEKC